MTEFRRAAFYARVSSQRQADEMTIQSQRSELIRRIERDQRRIDDGIEYCDDGYSGSALFRPALEKLRDHIAASM
ncbi:MAG: recombinase family protein, partial [Planctomyces sp.]|nr:recombinase family protein [Planctomyces sp.]